MMVAAAPTAEEILFRIHCLTIERTLPDWKASGRRLIRTAGHVCTELASTWQCTRMRGEIPAPCLIGVRNDQNFGLSCYACSTCGDRRSMRRNALRDPA